MPIHTGTGDKGETGLFDNKRVPKDDHRIEFYGTNDAVNSFIGLLRSEPLPSEFDEQLAIIQATLFELGSDLRNPGLGSPGWRESLRLLGRNRCADWALESIDAKYWD